MEAARSLLDIIQEVVTEVAGLIGQSPANADSTMLEILNEAANLVGTDSLISELTQIVITKLGLGPIVLMLNQIRFGTVKFNGQIKVKAMPDVKSTGTFTAPGVIVGSQQTAPSAVILNNHDYTSSIALKVSNWDDQSQKFAEFGYLDVGFIDSINALKEGLEVLLTSVVPIMPTGFLVRPVSDGIDAAIELLTKLGGTSGVNFKAFSGDGGIRVANNQAGSTGLEFRVIAMASNKISYTSSE